MEPWGEGMVEPLRKNINRGYMKLTVWQDAVEYYRLTCEAFAGFTHPLTRIASQQVASADSVHRNVAEGYCRRSIREYLQFLNVALASAGETVSALHAYRASGQISELSFDRLDQLAYKIENGLKRLIESLQRKAIEGGWQDSFVVKESNAAYHVDE